MWLDSSDRPGILVGVLKLKTVKTTRKVQMALCRSRMAGTLVRVVYEDISKLDGMNILGLIFRLYLYLTVAL